MGIGVVTTASGSDVVGDMAVEESGKVAAEEDSIIIMGPVGGEEARWTKMSTAGGDVVTMAWEIGRRVVEIGKVGGGLG